MKNIALTILAGTALAGTAFAGPMASPKAPVIMEVPCFQAGEFVVRPFFDITIFNETGDHEGLGNDAYFGGGIAFDYYVTDRFAIGFEGSWIDTPSVIQGYVVNATYRITDPMSCFSVYLLGGGGVLTNGSTVGQAHLGGGAEYRFSEVLSAFADGRYSWADGGDLTFTKVRIGLGINL